MKAENSINLNNFPIYTVAGIALSAFLICLLATISTLSNINMSINEILNGFLNGEHIKTHLNSAVEILFKSISAICLGYLSYLFYSVVDIIYSLQTYKAAVFGNLYREYDINDIIFKGISWKFYRIGNILLPFAFILTLSASALIISMLFFSPLSAMASFSIGISSFIFAFLISLLLFGAIGAVFYSVWNFIVSAYGFECAITEPFMSNDNIWTRSERLMLNKNSNIYINLLIFTFGAAVVYQMIKAVSFKAPVSLENIGIIIFSIILNLGIWALLKHLKTLGYVESILTHYNNITYSRAEYNKFSSTPAKENSTAFSD